MDRKTVNYGQPRIDDPSRSLIDTSAPGATAAPCRTSTRLLHPTSDRTPLKKGLKLKNLRPTVTSPRRRPHMYVFLLLNFGRDLDPGPNTRGTLAHTRASVRQTLATLSKHLRCSRLNTWPKLCYQPRS